MLHIWETAVTTSSSSFIYKITCSLTAALRGASCASISGSHMAWTCFLTFNFLDPHREAASCELSEATMCLQSDTEKLLFTIPEAADKARSSGFIRKLGATKSTVICEVQRKTGLFS